MEQIHQDRTGGLAAPLSAKIYEGRVARIHPTGDPLRYDWGEEYRDTSGLQEIADQLQTAKPFTLLHPSDLISRGSKADVVGQVISAHIDGSFVVAQILVTDAKGVSAIEGGMHELSLGYTSKLDETRHQREITVDHLALVPRARCGASCALRADCLADSECTCKIPAMRYNTVTMGDQTLHDVQAAPPVSGAQPAPQTPQRNIIMDELQKKLAEALASTAEQKARADQLDIELKAAKVALTGAEVDATNAKAALATEKKLTETANGRADQAKQDAEAAITQAKIDANSAMTAEVAARVQLLTEANQVLGVKDAKGQVVDRSALNDQMIRLAVIKHVDNLDFPVDKDPIFVQGVYAGSLARAAAANVSRASVRVATAQVRADATRVVAQPANGAREAEAAAKKAMQDDQAKRWRVKAN